MVRIALLMIPALLWLSCKQQESAEALKTTASDQDSSASFYPFPQYLKEQIAYVDSMPFAIIRIIKINGVQVDSGIVTKQFFTQSVLPFTDTDPNAAAYRGKFEETSFQDLSLEVITFSIKAKDTDLELQQADILLNPATKKVKNIMQKRLIQSTDSSVVRQLLWVHNMRCQVAESIQKKDGSSYTRSTSFIWDEPM